MLDNLPDSFFVAVKHRNHLGTMTAKEVLPLNSTATVDFTSMPLADYFTNPGYDTLAVTTMQGKRALWAGNTNKDAKTKYDGSVNDRIAIGFDILTDGLNNPSILNYANTMGYLQGDVNLDGRTKYDERANDRILLQNIVLTYPLNFYGSLVNNYDRLLEQLP